MKNLLFAVLLAAVGSAQATVYNFSMSNGATVMSGSFEGTANGNLITGLSNISAAIDGVAFGGSGSLYSAQYVQDQYYWAPGAVASFDGAENNFLFINSDYLGHNYTFDAFMYSVNWYDRIFASVGGGSHFYSFTGSPAANGWQVSAANAVPEPASLGLFGLGIAGLGAMRRRGK